MCFHGVPRFCGEIRKIFTFWFNSFPASGNFCPLLITFANSLDPDQAWQNVGPDMDPNCLTLWWNSWKIFWKIHLKKKKSTRQKKHAKLPNMQRVNKSALSGVCPKFLKVNRKTDQTGCEGWSESLLCAHYILSYCGSINVIEFLYR